MAVRIKANLRQKFSSAVETRNDIIKTTLEHVRRILCDHDYLKHASPDEKNNEKTVIVQDTVVPQVDQRNEVVSGIQELSGACSSGNSQVKEKTEQLPTEGIEASDLCTLLDKFEQVTGNLAILTPATSPGHSENCAESLTLKINIQAHATDLTPPTTPPIQEQPKQKPVQNVCKLSGKIKNDTTKSPSKKNSVKKGVQIAKGSKASTGATKLKKVKTTCIIPKKVERKTVKVKHLVVSESAKEGIELSEINVAVKNQACENKSNKKKYTDIAQDSKGTASDAKKMKIRSEDETKEDLKVSKENGIALPEKTSTADKSSEKFPVDKDICNGVKELSRIDDVADEKLPKLNEKKCDEVKELLGSQNCSNSDNVSKAKSMKVNSTDRGEHDTINNNNKEMETRDDACKTVSNNDELQVKKIGRKEHLNDNHKDHRDRSESRDIEKNSRRQSEQDNHDRRKRRHSSRSSSSDKESSDEERSDYRRSERYRGSRKYDCERSEEKYRKYSSKEDYDYDRRYSHEEMRRHCHDDNHNYNKKSCKTVRNIEHERKIAFRLGRSNIQDVAKEERRVIYVGGLPYGTTRDELRNRFRKFGPIEKITVHLRVGERDNYGFVTFFEPDDARESVEFGNSDPREPRLDLCFGGRRQFCGGSYVDFDSTTSNIEELSEKYGKVCDEIPEEDDFDSLLRMCQDGLRR